MQTPVPLELTAKLQLAYPEHASRILAALDSAPSVSIRLHPARTLTTPPHAELRDGAILWLPAELEGIGSASDPPLR